VFSPMCIATLFFCRKKKKNRIAIKNDSSNHNSLIQRGL